MALALLVHLALAVWLLRVGPKGLQLGDSVIEEPPLPVVFVRPLPAIVPAPPGPPPVPAPPAAPAQPAAPSASVTVPSEGTSALRPRRPDLVFVLEPPADADPGEPRVAGTAGVTLPEVAPESADEAGKIQEMPRSGWVVLRVLVRRDGSVQEVVPQDGGDSEAAGRMAPAVQALRFRPALQQGRPVPAWFTMVWPPG